MRRRFLYVGSRRCHLWTGGAGPAVILIHGSPGNARLVLPLAERLAARFSVYAFDTPGFGASDPLPGERLSVAVLADAYRDALDAASLDRVAVFGTHSGAAIGLELARRHPERVTAFVLEGVPIFTEAEQRPLLTEEYMPVIEPDILGSQYARAWTRFHDQFLWFPWNSRSPDQLLESLAGSAADIHLWVEMYFQAMRHYRPAYRAAISYGHEAIEAASRVRCPGVYLAAHADMLYAHLDRLPPLAAGQRIERVENMARMPERVEAAFVSLALTEPDVGTLVVPGGLQDGFFAHSQGQLYVRSAGTGLGTPILLLHDAPGAGRALEPLFDALSTHARVLLPDLPGCGLSDPLSSDTPDLSQYANVIGQLLHALGIQRVIVYAVGVGAALALALGHEHPEIVERLLLTGTQRTRGAERTALIGRLAPPLRLESDGAHWYRTWLMLRDSLVHWPWYDPQPASLRRQRVSFDARFLHEWTCEVMAQWHTYHHLVDAALAWSPDSALDPGADALTVCIDPGHAQAASDRAWAAESERHAVELRGAATDWALQLLSAAGYSTESR